MKAVDQRPSSGSCARCRASLGLASTCHEGEWYCSTACADAADTELAWEAASSEIRAALRLTRRAADHELDPRPLTLR